MTTLSREEEDILHCCGSKKFAKEMAFACRFADVHHAFRVARDIWFNKVAACLLRSSSSHRSLDSVDDLISPSFPLNLVGRRRRMARGRLGSPCDRSHLSVFSQFVQFFLFFQPFLILAEAGVADSIVDCTRWSKEEQSAAMATATDSILQVILRCVTGRFAKIFSWFA